jgi:hypothetical protein
MVVRPDNSSQQPDDQLMRCLTNLKLDHTIVRHMEFNQ